MDKLIDKFYNGSMHKFGFGTVNSVNTNALNHKVMTPRPMQIKYNNNQTLLNQNRSQNNINTRYNVSQTLFNNPVPKTQYSIGLNVPTTSDPLITKGLTLPYKKTEYNGLETVPNGQTKRYFKPEILKVQMLEQKIKEIEEKSKADKRRMREIIEGNVLNVNPPPNNTAIANKEMPEINQTNINNNNPASLEQAMNNLRSQNNGMLEFNQRQALRREQIQKELAQARDKLKLDKYTSYQSKETSEEVEEEEEEEDEEESDRITKKNEDNDILINAGMRPGPRNTLRTTRRTKSGRTRREVISPAQQEANDFIHNIPDHVALKLQNDNFKVRANLAQVKDGFRNIRNVLEDKLDALQMAQKVNFEKVRFIIEQGGNKKMIAGLKKLIDGEDIDINNIEEDEPEYIKNLPNIIEEKLKKNEELRREELNREKLEEQQMMDDEIGERFNVTNESALKQFNPDNIKNDNNTETNPWDIINHQTDYQYIPGRGVTSKTGGRLSVNKYNYLSGNIKHGPLDKNFNPYNKRMITEEHENIIVNKIAEKIFKTMKDNNFLTEGMLNNQNMNQTQIPQSKEPTKPASKEASHTDSFSVRDGLDERFSNLAENKKPSVNSKSKSSKTKSKSTSTKKSLKKKSILKKKKRKSQSTEEEEEEEDDDDEDEEEEDDEEGEEEEDDEEGEEDEDDEDDDDDEDKEEEEDDEDDEEEEEESKKKKKKKNKNKSSTVTESTENNGRKKKKSQSSEVTESSNNNKKKKKKSQSSEVTESSNNNKKKKKKSQSSEITESES